MKHEGDIRAELGKLPQTLNDSYAIIHERVKNTGKVSREIANKAIKWLLCSTRRLISSESIAAVSTCSCEETIIVSENQLLDICCNLIVLNDELTTFQFAHLSVREYFELSENFSKVQANSLVVQRCIDIWDEQHQSTLGTEQNNTLKAYATFYWPFHCQNLGSDPDDKVKRKLKHFLSRDRDLSSFQKWISDAKESNSWENSHWVLSSYFGYLNIDDKALYLFRQIFSESSSPFFLICAFGLSWMINDLDNFNHDSWNQANDGGNSGLGLATLCGHKTIVQFLLQRTGVDINVENQFKSTPLSIAAQTGQEAIIELLLRRSDIIADFKDTIGRTPLSLAAEAGYELAVQLLIDRDDVFVDSRDDSDRTPLLLASMNGHEAVVRLLLQHSNLKYHDNRRALLMAASYGHEAVMHLLLEHSDFDVNIQNRSGRTSLSLASKFGHESIVKLLLERKEIDINVADDDGITALSYAAWLGHEEICRLLLERDEIDAHVKDIKNQTPLSWAVSFGHAAVVRLLLERNDVDVNSKDGWRKTPL